MIARVTTEISLNKEFDYLIPPEFVAQVEVGSRVKVPFGARQVMGTVTAMIDLSPRTNLRSIIGVVGARSLVTPQVLELARWIGTYYCCSPEAALKSVLPDSVRKDREGFRERLFVRTQTLTGEIPKLTKRQQDVWNVIEEFRELPLARLIEMTGATAEVVRKLEDKGLVVIASEVSERDPHANEQIIPTEPLVVNEEQAAALKEINTALDAGLSPGRNAPAAPTFLLHGVTGSGKTEVYLQALAHTLEQGRGAIVLVPEISLTPQTVERFKARFCSGPLRTLVAVLHSHLSAGERHDEWHKIRQGRARIVIGARSAIFAPVESLGLIVVDEEHEHSYKQEEAPRYHARDVAIVRARMENAVVVLGSATPSMESYFNAQRGKYRLLNMLKRVDSHKLPIVRVIDMRQEGRREKGVPIFSQKLKSEIMNRLDRKEQVMLFLNRRGYSTSLQCPKCGYVAQCPNCSVTLTYHRTVQKLCCHICAHEANAPHVCPEKGCGNPAIRYAGLGTQKVEETLEKLFPKASIKRMDSDALKRKDDFKRILSDFRTGKVDILLGTQMIAKGLHFPNVTLVGIIHADLSLHQADFRAGERTFQLLTQVAGRAGRGDVEGEVIVQAFTPFHPAIQYARRHDYLGFYEQELEFREQLKYPPCSRICLLTIKGRNEDKVQFCAEHLRKECEKALAPLKDLILAGPAPSPLQRAETFYRYHLMLRTRQMTMLGSLLAPMLAKMEMPEGITITPDIDPTNLS